MRVLAAIATIIAVSTAASSTFAGEDELIAAVEPGYAGLDASGLKSGFGGSASLWIGTDTPFWVAGSAGVTGHFGLDDPVTFELLGGIVYAFDVFAVIPFAEVLGGFITGTGGLQPTARFGLGVDYLVTRTVSVGVVGRYRPIAEPLGNALMTATLRLAVRLEY